MSSKVIPFRVKGDPVDEVVNELNKLRAQGEIACLMYVGFAKDGSLVLGNSAMTANEMVYLSRYLDEAIMVRLRSEGVMPGP